MKPASFIDIWIEPHVIPMSQLFLSSRLCLGGASGEEVNMPPVTIYTTPYCPYCLRAKSLLTSKGVVFEEIDVSNSSEVRQAMVKRANGGYTVPQIFIGAVHVGGSDDLHALDAKGELDKLLQS